MSETKRCSVCGLEKPVNEFYIQKRNDIINPLKIYYSSGCKECKTKNRKINHRLNSEKTNERRRELYKENIEKERQKKRRRRIENPEKIRKLSREYQKRWGEKYPEKLKAKRKRNEIALRENLSNVYIKRLIRQRIGYPPELIKLIQPDMIENYRATLKLKRKSDYLLKILKNETNK